MKRDGKQAKYQLIKYDGHNEKYTGQVVRLYEDGSIKDARGYFVEQHPDGKEHEITRENARALNIARQEAAKEAVRQAIFEEGAAYIPNVTQPVQVYAAGLAHQFTKIWERQIPSMFDYEKLAMMAGWYVPAGLEQAQTGAMGPDPELVNAIAGLVDSIRLLKDG